MRRRPRLSRRRLALLALSACTALVLLLAVAPGAWADLLAPPKGNSPNAKNIRTIYDITLYIAIVIFILVWGVLLYTLIRFRARKGAVAAQIRGNTRLEIGWTVGAALILIALAVIVFAKLSAIENPPNSDAAAGITFGGRTLIASSDQKLPPNGKSLNIQVIGRQYVWQYVYPGANNPNGLGAPYTYENLVVPTGTTVTLDIQSIDVVHSWWIPDLGGKAQAVPGLHNYTWFKVDKPGTYRGQCAEICGREHARMIAQVTAVTPAQFDAWLTLLKQHIAANNTAAQVGRTALNNQTGPAAVENP